MPPVKEEAIQDAIEAISIASIRATTLYDVPPTTLSDRINSKSTRLKSRQLQRLLSSEQEKALYTWILAIRNPVSHAQIRQMASLFSSHSGGPTNCGKHWVQRFVQRYPGIHTKVGRATDHLRVEAVTPEALEGWFKLFQRVRQGGDIKPENIWNMDETGLALGHCKNQLVVGTSNTNKLSPQLDAVVASSAFSKAKQSKPPGLCQITFQTSSILHHRIAGRQTALVYVG
jgi:Tc5 transposase DNA-binding domain